MPNTMQHVKAKLADHSEGLTLTELFPQDRIIALASRLAQQQHSIVIPVVFMIAPINPRIWTIINMEFTSGTVQQFGSDQRPMAGFRCKYVLTKTAC